MLSFSKIFIEFADIKFKLLRNKRIKDSFSTLCPFTKRFNLTHCSLYSSTAEKDKRFSLQEFFDLKPCPLNYSKEEVSKLVSQILYTKSKGKNLPEYIKLSEIEDILELQTISQRMKFLTFLFKKGIQKRNSAEKTLKKKMDRENEKLKSVVNSDQIQYGLGKNTLLLQTWRRTVIKFYEKRLANCILFGQKIVIDLGYDEYMTRKERRNCASQLRLLFSDNRYHQDPYDLYFCNANPKSRCVQYLQEDMPTINQLSILYEQSYLDIFPKEDLVYLSPHAPETLKTYDHKAIYIIGGFVDTTKKISVSDEKARTAGIKCYSLPLEDYILWGCGGKSLSINQVFSIMQTMRDTGDWKEAFKHVPPRKLKRVQADSEEIEHTSDKLFVMTN